MATKLSSFLGHAPRVLDMEFQEIPSNGSGDTSEKIHCSPSKVPLIIDRSQPQFHNL